MVYLTLENDGGLDRMSKTIVFMGSASSSRLKSAAYYRTIHTVLPIDAGRAYLAGK